MVRAIGPAARCTYTDCRPVARFVFDGLLISPAGEARKAEVVLAGI